MIFGAVAAAAAALIGALFLLAPSDDLSADVRVDGDALPALQADGEDVAAGLSAPRLTGEGFDGEEVTLPVPGEPTAVGFMAHWCPSCQQELPVYGDWWQEEGGAPEGTNVVMVSTLHNPIGDAWPADEWMEDAGWSGPVMVDSDQDEPDAFHAYGATGTPFWVLVDADGDVVSRILGGVDPYDLADALREIRDAPPAPADAVE